MYFSNKSKETINRREFEMKQNAKINATEKQKLKKRIIFHLAKPIEFHPDTGMELKCGGK